jgi:hypothetical protein
MNDAADIAADLQHWLDEPGRKSQAAAREADLFRRAIAEIRALRDVLGGRRGTRSISAEDLNASNDE